MTVYGTERRGDVRESYKGRDDMNMMCNHCGRREDLSPLRLGKICGKCHEGKWIPIKNPAFEVVTSSEPVKN